MTRRGWYGAAEKADTFYFEHDWVPVPGHPAEVATCDICGLNRWSDEHMTQAASAVVPTYADPGYRGEKRLPVDTPDRVRTAWALMNQPSEAGWYNPAERAVVRARIRNAAAWHGIDVEQETAQETARLQRAYGPGPSAPHTHAPEMIAQDLPDKEVDPDAQDAREVEDKAIAASAKAPAAGQPHPFMPAEYPSTDGQPRCRLCGAGTPPHASFQPETPVIAAEGFQSTLTYQPAWTTTSWNSTSANVTLKIPTVTEVRERLAPTVHEGETPAVETEQAFVTEVNGRTLITGRASVFNLERAMAGNEHMLWMQGRFVGAERANRNGAFWTTGDLELGQASVLHGPLNWLHEARHVIGSIADARLISHNEAAMADVTDPYIEATSNIWRWIYPDEAWVIEQASDQNKLWYSMECISKDVECVGDGSCGEKATYANYLSGNGCEHMTQRSADRRFAEPTFLGGAVIVPPVRPGWAEADARVMTQAASMAEKAFDQAGRPDVQASEWEQVMAQLVRYATT